MTEKNTPRNTILDMSDNALKLPIDRSVKLPLDVHETILRGEAAFERQGRSRTADRPMPNIITSVMDQEVQDRRDAILDARASKSAGKRQQPPMIARLKAVLILVDRLGADGVPFGVGPNSKMNRLVREWLNASSERSPDPRKSRKKLITQGAVRNILKQVRVLLPKR
jgi:hypothetical protein